MNLREALRAKGASEAQLKSSTFAMAEAAIAEDVGLISDTARNEIVNLRNTLERANNALNGKCCVC